VGADGRIFITEFFDALGFIDPNSGTFTQIGNFDTGAFGFLDIGIDGNLYASSGRDFFRIDPLSGEADLVGSFDGTSVREIQVDADGNILFSGSAVLGDSSIFSLDPLDGSITTIINGDDIDTFFSIQDFDVFSPELRVVSAVPEPTSVTLFGLVAMVCCCRRRRFSLGL